MCGNYISEGGGHCGNAEVMFCSLRLPQSVFDPKKSSSLTIVQLYPQLRDFCKARSLGLTRAQIHFPPGRDEWVFPEFFERHKWDPEYFSHKLPPHRLSASAGQRWKSLNCHAAPPKSVSTSFFEFGVCTIRGKCGKARGR